MTQHRDTLRDGKLLTHAAQGEGWSRSGRFHAGDSSETAISLVGATLQLYVGELVFETVQGGDEDDAIELTDPGEGEFTISLTGDQTAALDVKRHALELWITRDGAEPIRGIEGTIEIHGTVRT